MRAAVRDRYGPPEGVVEVRELEAPALGDAEFSSVSAQRR